jgi:ubiquinone/menaquinone biosynthesis C-methylase UbiE
MDENEYKKIISKTFDIASAGYDSPELRFFENSADHLVSLLHLQAREMIMDFCTGTGHIPLKAGRFLTEGKVIGVDISEGMLQRARAKVAGSGIKNAEFICSDLESFHKDGSRVDIVTCAFGIFFLPDMAKALQTMKSFIRPGGRLVLTSFKAPFMEPQRSLLFNRLKRYTGTTPPPTAWDGINTEEKFFSFLKDKGFSGIRMSGNQCGYFLDKAEQWWNVIMYTNMRNYVIQLGEKDRMKFKEEHLKEVGELMEPGRGLWLNVEVLYADCTV